MRKLTILGIATLFMLLTQAVTAETRLNTKYNLCNKGKIEVRYATALRSGNFFSGYSWDLDGWYLILPGDCDDAYHRSDKDPDEPIYVAIAFRDSTGVWGAPIFPKRKELRGHDTETMDGLDDDIDTKLCVAKDVFKYRVSNINLPCQSGYFPLKAVLYLEPKVFECTHYLGQPISCWGGVYNFSFAMDDDSRAVAAGPSNGNGVAQPTPAKGTIVDFAEVLTDIIKRSWNTTYADRNWSACIDPPVVKAQSWKNPPAATIKSLQESVNRFLFLHDKGDVRFKITARPGNLFLVEEYAGRCAAIDYTIG